MNQLYKIGILVAILLLVLLGFSKLNSDRQSESPTAENENYATEESDTNAQTQLQTQESKETQETNMNETQENTMVRMETNKGDITIELFTKDMPITAGNFLKLAEENFYDGIKFHRVIGNFMVQAGDPNSKDDSKQSLWGTGGPGYAIEDEFNAEYSNMRGTLSMANSGPNSGGSQFFINLVDNTNLDFNKPPETSKHPVFGRVVEGMDVVDAIGSVETGVRDIPVEPVVIKDITIIEEE